MSKLCKIDCESGYSVYQFQIPTIPAPSPHLSKILADCNSLHQASNLSRVFLLKKSKSRNKKKRRINGFIAFRSFYSKSIKGASTQRELSTKLSTAWRAEPNRHIWKCYALQYNAAGGEEDFISWLLRNLGISNEKPVQTILRTSQNKVLNNVEDVFLV